jgi:hypothetical protein
VLDEQFPTMMGMIRQLKRHNYRHLAHLAQRTESHFIFGCVVSRLQWEYPDLFVTTIHDSIMTTEGAAAVVHGAMMVEFRKLGIQPIVKFER